MGITLFLKFRKNLARKSKTCASKYFDVYFKWELHYFLNSGKTWQEKVKHVRGTMKKRKADALVVTALDEIAC